MKTVRDLQPGAPGGVINRSDLRSDWAKRIWVRLDAKVYGEDDAVVDPVEIRSNYNLVEAPDSLIGFKAGSDVLIEIPFDQVDPAKLPFTSSSSDTDGWALVTLWKPWARHRVVR